ncbi:30S ribosomal protein S1 [Candidatus Liberibacter solanacearum]|uniref:30S ribosomal protein S1 n=2 Tax=Candidatus Liberibacter solanacearum TaxID=556287 RepID=A0A0F4VI04_9HYPH|nr:30S ribosomal protein S1 [Candidatus Liberibacter solanacearum]KJZ81039.1 30S ribosomal protein S1 [Candidatus Liberibacter solanacearum]KJZ82219.1 SSU ribosomal protein S1p [Candidatus Liberibacter solanacearum]KQC49360.1 30S ribosomal protein S1 [Candidatus Liberibacter solanacearum]
MSFTCPSREDFATLLEDSFSKKDLAENCVSKGIVVSLEKDIVVVDAGLKFEGRIPLKEFMGKGQEATIKVGDEVEVYIERIENSFGEAVFSRDKALREGVWEKIEAKFAAGERIEGVIFNQVKGGLTVDLNGEIAFLPRSQIDVRPIRDVTPLMHEPQLFEILKMDKRRGNIVVSRRAVLEESRAEQRSEIVQKLEEGQVIEGIVKNITDYGAFVDLSGVDGLLHVTDIAWHRIQHPSKVLSVGQKVKVQIIRINQETHRISLGMKQLEKNPWDDIKDRYVEESKVTGVVTNITDYGAFIELEAGIEGLAHISEISWTKKNIHPSKILSVGQEVEVVILEINPVRKRISLGLKQALINPWKAFSESHPPGTEVEGEIKNKTEFGLFIGLDDNLDGMVHLSDLDWNRPGERVIGEYNKGDVVKAIILDVDIEKERISLGIKQLSGSAPDIADSTSALRKNTVVSCEVIAVNEGGVEVSLIDHEGITSFIRRSDLSRDRADQDPGRFSKGQIVDARVVGTSRKDNKVSLSIKALEIAEERGAIAQFGSSDSGASLGDILGIALKNRGNDSDSNK